MSGSPEKLPPSYSQSAIRPDVAAARTTASRVENVMKQANQLQQQTKDLASEESLLKEQVEFAVEEKKRVEGVVKNLKQELDDTKFAVRQLVHEKELHRCTATNATVDEYEETAQQLKQKKYSLSAKEKQIHAILQETQQLMDSETKVTAQAADSMTQLRRAVEEQDAEINMLTDLHDEESRLLEEYVDNENTIKALRAQIESCGLDIPNAPTVHRRRHIIERRQRSDRLAGTGGSSGENNNNKEVVGSALITRTIYLPVGCLRLLTEKLGTLEKIITKDCGVDTYSLEISDTNTLVHCKGRSNCIDALESKLNSTLEYLLSGSYATSGLITYANRNTGDAATVAAGKISQALLLDGDEAAPTTNRSTAAADLVINDDDI